jgi:glyoxylase-like metal-dependent hydrolase (beta-lactamase superfamily II)
MTPIETIDTLHNGNAGIVAVYVIRHAHGALLIDCGPGSTLPTLVSELGRRGLEPRHITDVLLTHIHLDHGGAAGWWAQQGATIHVHPVGAPHLLNPEKLLTSAQRIYGDDMQRLWGDFLAVPETQLIQHHDNDVIEIGGHTFTALDTPGHAEHHFAYVFQDICFSGDVGGVRVNGRTHIRPPTPPPEIHFEKWRASIQRLREAGVKRMAPTHFGLYDDAQWHLDKLERTLDHIQEWTANEMAAAPTQEQFREKYVVLLNDLAAADGYDTLQIEQYNNAAGGGALADGVYRYWKKYRQT